MSELIEKMKKLTSNLGRDYSSGDQFVRNGTSQEVVEALRQSIVALSEAQQREKDARRAAIEDVLSALTTHELYQYRPKAFKGFIDYARSALQSEER